ncbi:MAG: hypothetical protein MK033_11710 [Candidatus Caenarcaniphilales bacterium]|nr:hypothetical protein [Candidatus Caenarcaniphilales bacterium]
MLFIEMLCCSMMTSFLSLFSYKACYKCKKKITGLKYSLVCKDCINVELNPLVQKVSTYLSDQERVFYAFEYSDKFFQKLIKDLKYRNKFLSFNWGEILAYKLSNLSNIVYDSLIKADEINKIYISYVPIHLNKLKSRKFNQSELIARNFVKSSSGGLAKNNKKVYFVNDLFIRHRDTPVLYDKKSIDRESILEDSFSINQENWAMLNSKLKANDQIWIIDDICTTGITLRSLIRILVSKGMDSESILGLACTGRNFKT